MMADDRHIFLEAWQLKRERMKGASELPDVQELAQIIDSPLLYEEKIPITSKEMSLLVLPPSTGMINDFCDHSDVELLFRVGSGGDFSEIFTAVKRDPPIEGTRKFFISFWDRNIREILELFLPYGESIRNSNEHAATGILRPNYGFLLDNLCLFWGEERGPSNRKDLRKDLADKLLWVYSPAPYVLGRSP
jgi:hypothetical protein